MIFITGDTHGDWKNRFKSECFPLNRSDYVIVWGLWLLARYGY